MLESLLQKKQLEKSDLITLLSLEDENDCKKLYEKAYQIKTTSLGKKVFFRGLIEFSNICSKNCFYCGIRKDIHLNSRYQMSEQEIIDTALKAYSYNYGSIVLQSGECSKQSFIEMLIRVLKEIHKKTENKLGITLCVGEQSKESYQKLLEAGAHRYLLRIESSNQSLYEKLHPKDHSFQKRLQALKDLQDLGYQTGTGVMIGLPFQSIEDLADDLLFFRNFSIDMVGMGPFIEHENTPIYAFSKELLSKERRFQLSLNMIALLRILMSDVNIAATTALQAIDPIGREKALLAGANVLMPNMTPLKYREDYQLYEDKPCIDEDADQCRSCLATRLSSIGEEIAFKEKGDPLHYFSRRKGDKKSVQL